MVGQEVYLQKKGCTVKPIGCTNIVDELDENKDLTEKQKMFSLYYLQCFNATWAYQKSYHCGYDTAMTNGSKMLRNTKIRNQLTVLKKQQSADLYLDLNDIIMRYIQQANSDIKDIIDFKTVKKLAWSEIYDDAGPYEDVAGHYRYAPKIDPETGEPNKVNDDVMDTIRYMIATYKRIQTMPKPMDRKKGIKDLGSLGLI